jgi:hypothetical protein
MYDLDSGYTVESAVGPVWDLTRWSGRGHLGMGFAALAIAVGSLAAAAFVWDSTWFFDRPPAELKQAVAELNGAWKTHPLAMQAGVAVGASFGVLCLLGASAMFTDAFRDDYFFRAGPGGVWLRLPHGLSWAHLGLVSKPIELELPWEEIAKIEVTQVKQAGSLSRNAGNLRAEMAIRARSGERHVLQLDGLEAAAYLIHERLNEARQQNNPDADWPDAQPATAGMGGSGSWHTP